MGKLKKNKRERKFFKSFFFFFAFLDYYLFSIKSKILICDCIKYKCVCRSQFILWDAKTIKKKGSGV
jgi:uncharacterized membrane protein